MWFLYLLLLFNLHDFHVSRTVLDYQAEENTFQVRLHVFTDDLELALKARGADSLRLNTKWEHPQADSLISVYIGSVIQIQQENGQFAAFRYLGKESSDDYMATWIYFYMDLPSDQGNYILINRLLTAIYDDQQNIVKIEGTNEPVLRLLTVDDQKMEFTLP